MEIETLIYAQQAAHAAWLACPDKKRAEKSALANALADAARAVAAAKRAEMPVVGVSEAVDAALARQAANNAREALVSKVARALRLKSAANEWPRCGQGWGHTAGEAAAEGVIVAYPSIVEEIE